MRYHVQIHKEDDGFWAECVELPGCVTQGDSKKELFRNICEAIALYLEKPHAARHARMTKKQRAHLIGKILDELFPEPEIPLAYQDPFTLLVAVVLSQSTSDKGVNAITPKLFCLANTPQKMAALPLETLEAIIRPIGLARSKAKNLIALSRILVDKYQGKIPATPEELEELPGVGHKTASIILTQVFGLPAFPVDTHIFRSARRWKLSSGKTRKAVEEDLKKLFPQEEWGRRHLQIIHAGRTYCRARPHDAKSCPLCSLERGGE